LPPVPPCVNEVPEVKARSTELRREAPWKLSTEIFGDAGREGKSLNQAPSRPPQNPDCLKEEETAQVKFTVIGLWSLKIFPSLC
jgi:hypothetical protein